MTTASGRTAVASRASMNMPAWSSRRGLGTRAFTVIVRPGSWTIGSTKSTVPVNSLPGSAATRNVTRWPTLEPLGVALRHLERRRAAE